MIIGPYRVLSPIASGGFGKVFLARRSAVPGFSRLFAMKCLQDRHAEDGSALAMLIDEARLASRINHANVLSVIDVVDHGGALWLVMEYVEGESLANLVSASEARGARVPLPIAIGVGAAVFHGLHAAHEATDAEGQPLGLVHRDVSPHNILVTSHGTPKIHDFGIAKARGRIALTEPGHIKGKLAYMAPEHLSGGDVDRRADIYSMGVVLWEAIATRRLFASSGPETAHERNDGAALAAELEAPPALRAVVARCLARRAQDRFATAAEAASAIEAAGPIASEREIAGWVNAVAADAIAARRAIAEQSAPDAEPPAGAPRDPDEIRTESAIAVGGGAPRERDDAGPSETEPGRPSVAPPAAPRPRRLLLFAAAGLAGAIAATAAAWGLGGNQGHEPPTETPPASAPTPANSADDPARPTSAPPASSANATASALDVPSAASGGIQRPASPAPKDSGHRSKTRPDPCDPPYAIDDRGVKVIKPGCVR